jgi:hypothetical protein
MKLVSHYISIPHHNRQWNRRRRDQCSHCHQCTIAGQYWEVEPEDPYYSEPHTYLCGQCVHAEEIKMVTFATTKELLMAINYVWLYKDTEMMYRKRLQE